MDKLVEYFATRKGAAGKSEPFADSMGVCKGNSSSWAHASVSNGAKLRPDSRPESRSDLRAGSAAPKPTFTQAEREEVQATLREKARGITQSILLKNIFELQLAEEFDLNAELDSCTGGIKYDTLRLKGQKLPVDQGGIPAAWLPAAPPAGGDEKNEEGMSKSISLPPRVPLLDKARQHESSPNLSRWNSKPPPVVETPPAPVSARTPTSAAAAPNVRPADGPEVFLGELEDGFSTVRIKDVPEADGGDDDDTFSTRGTVVVHDLLQHASPPCSPRAQTSPRLPSEKIKSSEDFGIWMQKSPRARSKKGSPRYKINPGLNASDTGVRTSKSPRPRSHMAKDKGVKSASERSAAAPAAQAVPAAFLQYREPEDWELNLLSLEKGEWGEHMSDEAFRRWRKDRPSLAQFFQPPS